MKDYKNLKDWIDDNNKHIFDKHIATRTNLPTGKNDCCIHFEDPETSNGWMDFIYCNGVLTIQGDYGNCSLCWYNKTNSIEVLANFAWNMGYFLSKLESAERCEIPNRYALEFNQDACIEQVEKDFEDSEKTINEEFDAWEYHTEDYHSWIAFCREDGEKFFQDQDAWEYMYNYGQVNTQRAYLWCYGLIKAIEYMEKEK